MVRAARPEKERNRRAPDVLQVFVAQGVVAHQVRLALRKGKTGDWEPSARRPAGRGRRRRQRLPRLRVRRTRRPTRTRQLRKGDVRVVWKLDRLGRNLAHLVNTVQDLSARGVGLRVLTGQGAQIDTTTAAGRLSCSVIFAALAEFERELIRERTVAGPT